MKVKSGPSVVVPKKLRVGKGRRVVSPKTDDILYVEAPPFISQEDALAQALAMEVTITTTHDPAWMQELAQAYIERNQGS